MHIDRLRGIALGLGLLSLLGGCGYDFAGAGRPASTFGEANRQTLMAQVIDPEPEYDTLAPETSAEHAAQAVERYRKDTVKKPERVSSTESSSSGSGGGGR